MTLEEGFWAGVAFKGQKVRDEAWFLSKACFYCFGFLLEAAIVYTFLAARVSSRFRLRPREVLVDKRDGMDFEIKMSRYERLVDQVSTEMEVFGHSG